MRTAQGYLRRFGLTNRLSDRKLPAIGVGNKIAVKAENFSFVMIAYDTP